LAQRIIVKFVAFFSVLSEWSWVI